jgi:hypothetical protein
MLKEKHLSFHSKSTGGIAMKTAQYTKSLTVSLRPEVFDQIKRITDEEKISIGEWVRDAVDAALPTIQQKEEKKNDQFRNSTIVS